MFEDGFASTVADLLDIQYINERLDDIESKIVYLFTVT